MCFSAEASFSASAVLVILGIATLRQVSSPKELFLAAMPFLFALQQFFEGVLWVHMKNNWYPSFWANVSVYVFMLVAFVLWPVWSSLAFLSVEKDPQKRKILQGIMCLGSILALWNFYYLVAQQPTAQVFSHSIFYTMHTVASFEYYMLAVVIYVLAAILPFFISSLKHTKAYGVVLSITIAFILYAYSAVFASLFCFAAAIYSGIVYKMINDLKKENVFT